MLKRLALGLAVVLALAGVAYATLPAVPPLPDSNRTITYTVTSSTTTFGVPFAVYGDCSDIQVLQAGILQNPSAYTCQHSTGLPVLNTNPLPITDMQVVMATPVAGGTLTINGAYHPRNVTVPTAPGISRREYEQVVNTILAGQRETYATLAPLFQLPPPILAANNGVCFDSTGLLFTACVSAPSGSISVAMEGVVNAPTILAAQLAFGVGAGAGLQADGSGNLRVTFKTAIDTQNSPVAATFHDTVRIPTGPLTYTFPASTTFWNGFGFYVYPNPGAITLSIAGTDAFLGQSAGASMSIPSGQVAHVFTDAASHWFVEFVSTTAPTTVPAHFTGEKISMRGTTCPTGSLPEDGSAISRTTYSALFAYIGTAWGAGNGTTTFNVPNAGGEFERGWEVGQTTDAGRAFASFQQDMLTNHTHIYNNTLGTNASSGTGTFVLVNVTATNTSGATISSGATSLGSETRPVNITALSCIWTGAIK